MVLAGGAAPWAWPTTPDELTELQRRLGPVAAAVLEADPWRPTHGSGLFGGCFAAPRRGTAGPGRRGDPLWAAAVVCLIPPARPMAEGGRIRRPPGPPRPARPPHRARPAGDVLARAVVTAPAPAAYEPGLLGARDGAVLAQALRALDVRPDVVLLDATGLDHPRRAGLAVHLGAASALPTVGVTRRPLVAIGTRPTLSRGASSPLFVDGRCVAYWVCTRSGVQPLVAHGGWRTSPEVARSVVLEASTPFARTPVPLREARRLARDARATAGADG